MVRFATALLSVLIGGSPVVVAGLPPAVAAPEPRSAAPPAFDERAALALSQQAIGRIVPADYRFTTAEGRTVRLGDYRGKPLVVSLVYTSCYHICPTTTRYLARVVEIARAALGEESFRVVTIGFDSARDTPAAMRAFAREQGVDLPGWDFLSGDRATIAALSRDLGFQFFPSAHGFDHLIQATVLDAEGRVYRQVYGMQFETPLLVEPLKELVFGVAAGDSPLAGLAKRVRLFCTVYDAANDRYRFDYSLFIGMVIGATSLLVVGFAFWREWRRLERVRGA
jgi:protein SCO1/2